MNNTHSTEKSEKYDCVTPFTSSWQFMFKIAAVASFLKLIFIILLIAVAPPEKEGLGSAEEYYQMLQDDRIMGILKLDWSSIILLSLFFVTLFALYGLYKGSNQYQPYVNLAMLLTVVVTATAYATNSIFSIIHLSDKYNATTDPILQSQLIAAGEAIIASDTWHSTASFFGGPLSQGTYIIMLVVMWHSSKNPDIAYFRPLTIYTGLLGNGLDLTQHYVNYVAPGIAEMILMIGGLFYMIWFVFLGLDFWKLGTTKLNQLQ